MHQAVLRAGRPDDLPPAGVRIVGSEIRAVAAVVRVPVVLYRDALADALEDPAGAGLGAPAAAVLRQRLVLDSPVADVAAELGHRPLQAFVGGRRQRRGNQAHGCRDTHGTME